MSLLQLQQHLSSRFVDPPSLNVFLNARMELPCVFPQHLRSSSRVMESNLFPSFPKSSNSQRILSTLFFLRTVLANDAPQHARSSAFFINSYLLRGTQFFNSNNSSACNYDNGDCDQCNELVEDSSKIGNGFCDGGLYMHSVCMCVGV